MASKLNIRFYSLYSVEWEFGNLTFSAFIIFCWRFLVNNFFCFVYILIYLLFAKNCYDLCIKFFLKF